MTRKFGFWIGLSVFSASCIFYAWSQFEHSFPFVKLEVKMDRAEALREAQGLAEKQSWLPKVGAQHAVSFETDSPTQNFIELEAGGSKALAEVLKDGIYTPYAWRVRHFAEGQTEEAIVLFNPEGKPWGFEQKLSETAAGPALKAEEARTLAEAAAVRDWGVDLAPYKRVETSSETRKSKRVDHSFIYEREDKKVGQGRYRLKLEVSGDRLTEVSRSIRVPDSFRRRYSELRSANGAIAQLAGVAIALLYGLGICGFGLFFLARGRWLQWRMPLIVAGMISGLHFLEQINRLPLEWMEYDTAISTQAFALRHVAVALLQSLFDFILVLVPVIAAEALSRKAFPSQPQLWRVFSRQAIGTRAVFGRILGAYLFVAFHFAFVVWIYRVGAEKLGWWNPSELLFHPDELATYFPWLSSVANSLHAGLWEECLFRAVPLAGAALLGNRFGGRKVWIAGAFVLQAVVFGAAHASYPTQPSYARLVELLVPSTVFGGAYLAFGLLPGILMHYIYDVSLFAMPLFLSSGTSAILNRAMVIGISGLPLWMALYARFKAGAWSELPERFYNRAWSPASGQGVKTERSVEVKRPLSVAWRRGLALSGVAALALWAATGVFKTDAPGLSLSRAEAIAQAQAALDAGGVKLGAEWQARAIAEGAPADEDELVWKTDGPDEYRKQIGVYLPTPHWKVRFVRLEGDIVERAEEWQVFIARNVAGGTTIERIRHELPESRAGESLEEAQARVLAVAEVESKYGVKAAQLEEISSNQMKLPARSDWLFTWRDPAQKLKLGEARLAVKLSGKEVVGTRRYVHVPEEWLRTERSRKSTMGVIKMLSGALLAIAVFWTLFLSFRGWVQGRFDGRVFALSFAAILGVTVLLRINESPAALAQFSTAQPWATQIFRVFVTDLLLSLVVAAVSALCLGRVQAVVSSGVATLPTAAASASGEGLWLGYACGAWIAAFGALAGRLGRESHPLWPSVSAASAWVPPFEGLQAGVGLLGGAAFLMLFLPWLRGRVQGRRVLRFVAMAALGLCVAAFYSEGGWTEWLYAGAASAMMLFAIDELVARTSAAILVPMMAAASALRAARGIAFNAYPGSTAYCLVLIAVVFGVSAVWWRKLGGATSRLKN